MKTKLLPILRYIVLALLLLCIVLCRFFPVMAIEVNGEAKKFFTNSEEMKNILAQVKEMPDGFPFETTIKTETFGKGRTKYVFT